MYSVPYGDIGFLNDELILDRKIGKYTVPSNVMIIAAGNRICDGAVSYEMGSAISDRFIHFDVMTSIQSWMKWAGQREELGRPIVPGVKAFLQARPEFLDEGFKSIADNDDKINPSPRSWEKISNILEKITDDQKLKIILPGILGAAAAHEFFFCLEEIGSLAPMSEYIRLGIKEDVEGIKNILPNKITGLYGLSYSLSAYCKTEEDFIGACFVFNILGSIVDNLPRKEILVTGVISLFTKAQKIDNKKLPQKICKSPAYKTMREEHMHAFADLKTV